MNADRPLVLRLRPGAEDVVAAAEEIVGGLGGLNRLRGFRGLCRLGGRDRGRLRGLGLRRLGDRIIE